MARCAIWAASSPPVCGSSTRPRSVEAALPSKQTRPGAPTALTRGRCNAPTRRSLCSEKPIDRDDARREHLDADTQQDKHRGLMAIDGENPAALEHHAKLLRREAAAAVQLAVEEERRAREIRLNRATARQRFGVA